MLAWLSAAHCTQPCLPRLPCPPKVAAGYRCPISPELPDSLRQLVSDCLAGDCDLRPR